MDLKVIDNFLSDDEFNFLVSNTIGRNDGQQVQFRVVSNVENFGSNIEEYWSWYMINMIYSMDSPQSEMCGKLYQMFAPKFKQVVNFKTMIRIKMTKYNRTFCEFSSS